MAKISALASCGRAVESSVAVADASADAIAEKQSSAAKEQTRAHSLKKRALV